MYKYFLGIDISKDSFDVCFTDQTEKVLLKDHYLIFPEMLKNTNIFTKSSLNLLLQAPSKRVIRNLKEKKIAKLFSCDNTTGTKPKITASEILSLAKNSIGINNLSLEKILISKIHQLVV